MTPDESVTLEEDRFAALFAAHEEALLSEDAPVDDRAVTSPELNQQLERDLCCARKLRRVLRLASAPPTGLSQLGRFQVRRELGRGGFGIVYQAHDPLLGREVAVKVPRPEIVVTPELRRRFESEARAIGPLDHPNLVPVYEVGDLGASCYIVSAYCPGPNLAEWLAARTETVPVREAAQLTATLANALGYAHSRGIVHRDLKPSNVLLASGGREPPDASSSGGSRPPLAGLVPRITDFGLAKNLADAPADGLTRSGAIVGTPSYMAPEQASGKNREIGPSTDVWALGVLLYELLTGRAPFHGDTAVDTLVLVRTADPVPPSRLRAKVPPDLETICLKCLHKEPAKRYPDGAALADDLGRFLAGQPIRARRAGALEHLALWCRRHPGVASLSAILALLLVTAAAVSTTLAVWAIRAEGLAETRLASEIAERESAVQAEAERKRQLVAAKLSQARAGRRSRQPGQRIESLAALTEAARLARELQLDEDQLGPLRDEMIACLALADVRHVRTWQGLPPGSDDRVGFDADLENYARSDRRGNIEVRQVEGDRLLARLPAPGVPGSQTGAFPRRFSPDGRLLAVHYRQPLSGKPTNFQVWDWRQERVVYEPLLPVEGDLVADFSADGRRLALALRGGKVAVLGTDSWQEVARLDAGFTDAQLAFHPDGNRLAVAVGGGKVQVWDVSARKILRRMSVPSGGPHLFSLCWHPAGTLLAAGGDDLNVYLWDAATGNPHATLHGHQSSVVGVCFVAGGEFLVSTGWDDTTRLWDPWTGQELLVLTGDTRHVSRDGRRIATRAAVNLTVRELEPVRERWPLPATVNFWDWDISPDGRWLVGGRHRLLIWDLLREREVGVLPGDRWSAIRFHPRRPELFTAGSDGLFRWSFEVSGEALRIRPTRRLLASTSLAGLAFDSEGRRLAVTGEGGIRFLDLEAPSSGSRFGRHSLVSGGFLSPDGKWAASATHNGAGVRVWDVQRGRLAKDLVPDAPITWAAFSPDGRWLVTSTSMEFEIWEVVTWRPVRRIAVDQAGDGARFVTFSRDGAVMALAVSLSVVQLFEVDTWRPLGRLTESHATHIQRLGFTPDGRQLLVSTLTGALRVWDLPRLREQLGAAGLDWDRPDYKPLPPRGDVKPIRVEVDVAAYERLAKP